MLNNWNSGGGGIPLYSTRISRTRTPHARGSKNHVSETIQIGYCGGGGGSRTRVRNYLQQRAFMLFRVPFCLVIDAKNGRRHVDDQSDRSRPFRPDGAVRAS